ncbi:MAG: hypothetical protein D6756_02680 [Cyanobacteria bacterium J083]|nr:MAG: hypothetical protein D6756_02680 [Cyanobacteria bacterium J083]
MGYLNPIIRGWANYYKYGVSKRVFSYIDHQLWKALWQWAKKRHPKKARSGFSANTSGKLEDTVILSPLKPRIEEVRTNNLYG